MKYSQDPQNKSFIELPDPSEVTDEMFDFIIENQQEFPLDADATTSKVRNRDAKLCALYVKKYGAWKYSGYTADEFIKYLDSEEAKRVQLVSWFRNIWDGYIKELLAPNVYASS